MLRFLLCATSGLLCISVVITWQRNLTTETRRTTELQRNNSFAAQNEKQTFDPKAYYKPNCAECHGSAAEKRFNPDSPESQMIDSILNGAKAENTRDMPAFAEKGIDEAKAKVLINYMKSIRE
jgi:mono/diheme cytochrome c family protein